MKNLIRKFIPQSLIALYHFLMALFGAILYRFPSRNLKIIAITGTNGKSTTVELTTAILEEAGYKVAALSSVKFKIKEKELPNNLRMTMPGRLFVQKFLRQAANAKCDYAVLEVTSEGIKQYRHKFVALEAALLTNLTPEHIEAHGGFENYRKAKGKLFEAAKKIHIVNFDDENADYFLQFPAKKKYLYQIKNKKSKIKITNQNSKILEEIDDLEINLNLPGEFNIYNALAAICVGLSQEISLETCKSALKKIEGIPGRMELVVQEPFKVFVDYAFTPNALEKVYQTLAQSLNHLTARRLICVLGSAGGGRDKWKRPVLGKIAAKYCREIIITNEDPYDENPLKIMEDIESGFSQIPKYEKILDRREAIRKSLQLAKPDDIVIITGKGCESFICLAGGKTMPWDDRRVVKEEFEKIYAQ